MKASGVSARTDPAAAEQVQAERVAQAGRSVAAASTVAPVKHETSKHEPAKHELPRHEGIKAQGKPTQAKAKPAAAAPDPVKAAPAPQPASKPAAAKSAPPKPAVAKAAPSKPRQDPAQAVEASSPAPIAAPDASRPAPVAVNGADHQAETVSAQAAPIPAVVAHRPSVPQGPMNGRPPVISRNSGKDEIFVEGDHVVYPTHGVGRVEKIAVEDIAGHRLELIHITFEENRMTLRVPVAKARTAGLRKLATRKIFDEALAVLRGRARIKRTMWSRRAQEYEAKINSGDPLAIAEVVRDLHRNAGQPDQSFSERQIYEAAMDRLAAELGALDQTDKATAATKLANFLKTIT